MRIYFCLFFICLLAACDRQTWYVIPSGLHYRIVYTNGHDSMSRVGATVKIRYIQSFHDTVRQGTGGQMPVYQAVIPGMLTAYSPLEPLFYGLRQGDSVEVIQRLDSMVHKEMLPGLPPGAKGSDEWTTRLVVERVFGPDLLHPGLVERMVAADKATERHRLDSTYSVLGPRRVTAWLQSHQIKAAQTDSGICLRTLDAGAGPLPDTGSKVRVIMKVSTLTGQTISLPHDTLTFTVGKGGLPHKLEQVLRQQHAGAHVQVYLPTMDAFGGNPPGLDVPPYQDMLFDMQILTFQGPSPMQKQ